jgi:glucose 1-dehydrogenase
MSLKNKVAIVTGGNSGIGQAIVLELARQEASIVIDYVVHPEATEALERQISNLGSQSIGVAADVSNFSDLEKLVEAAVSAAPELIVHPHCDHLDVTVPTDGGYGG